MSNLDTFFPTSGGLEWVVSSTGIITAEANLGYLIYTDSTSRVLNLPVGVVGESVGVNDVSLNSGTNNIVIVANGTENIIGNSGDYVLDTDGSSVILTYADSTTGWAVTGSVGLSTGGGTPTGTVISLAVESIPSGFLECDGAAISRTTYSSLYAAIGTLYGVGDGSTTFNIPDYRGKFLRAWDHGAGVDPDAATRTDSGNGTTGDNVGTLQADIFEEHDHIYNMPYANSASGGGGAVDARVSSGHTGTTGGNETRPINVNVMYCIKY